MPVELGTTNIIGSSSQGGFNFTIRQDDNPQLKFFPPATRIDILTQENITNFTHKHQKQIDEQHFINVRNIDGDIDKSVKDEGGSNEVMNATTPKDIVTKEHVIHVKLYYNSKAEQQKKIEQATSLKVEVNIKPFYGVTDLFPHYEYKNTDVRKQRLIDWALGYEAVRLAQVHEETARRLKGKVDTLAAIEAEQARLAAQAESKRSANEAAAKAAADTTAADAAAKACEEARLAAEAIRTANTFRAPGPASAAGPLFITSAGKVAVVEAAALTLQAAIRAAITALGGVVAGAGAGLVVGVSALFYSSKLANGELPVRYVFSTPVSDLDTNLGPDLNAVAAAGTIDLPYRIGSKTAADDQSEVFLVKTDGETVPSKVRVVVATYDAAHKVYTATTADVPPKTLTWTPIVNPGNSSATSPAAQLDPPIYTGATVTPVEGRTDAFPAVIETSFDDFITIFPFDSGLPPIYTMFRDRREDPGVATGVGQPVSGTWLGAAAQGEGAPIPSQIADQLNGKLFKNFKAFREAFWKAVANDPELVKQFSRFNVAGMRDGLSPFPPQTEQVGGREKYEIHHVTGVGQDGAVYDVDNMRITTPKLHINIHSNKGA
ncbi:hypothetical protein CJF43_05275 [Pseudomonas fragi]|uniref:Pyosin/cloacin translocation domain-containing protein n=1 Tax=Pseudomonas fragi TaxID=296 RepID=A0A266LY62_PSEFR|nr:S-type pyocin domain-containing protein [Pseudomonas fragi]OZY43001.1 hypothetical protein CJF43_05275 [Pseudomonas fragi]